MTHAHGLPPVTNEQVPRGQTKQLEETRAVFVKSLLKHSKIFLILTAEMARERERERGTGNGERGTGNGNGNGEFTKRGNLKKSYK